MVEILSFGFNFDGAGASKVWNGTGLSTFCITPKK